MACPAVFFDPAVAHPARMVNAWIGGTDHFQADRDAAAAVAERRPQVVASALSNRQFLIRAVRYMATCHGIRQFLDIGCGLPAPGGNTHEAAQRADRWPRVVYTDNDPFVLARARTVLASTPEGCCDYLHADLRDTGYLLRQAGRTLDFARPVAVLMLAVLQFAPDADDPAGIVADLAGALAPVSFVAITHLTADFAPEAVNGAVRAYNKQVPAPVIARTHAQVAGLFAGLPLIAPGITPVSEWRPDTIIRPVTDLYAGVARKPPRPW
jgi:hypothetical protein